MFQNVYQAINDFEVVLNSLKIFHELHREKSYDESCTTHSNQNCKKLTKRMRHFQFKYILPLYLHLFQRGLKDAITIDI